MLFRSASFCWSDEVHVMATELFFRQIGDEARTLIQKYLNLEKEDNYERLSMAGAWINFVERPPYNTYNFHHWKYTRTPILKDDIENDGHQNLDDMVEVGKMFASGITQNTITQNWPQNLAMKVLLGLLADIYSPVHNSELFSNEFKEGDNSGEKFYVLFNGKNVSLSWFWETGCGRYTHELPFTAQQWKNVDKAVDNLKEKFIYRTMKVSTDFTTVHSDSYNISVNSVYDNIANGDTLTEEYINKCITITDERIARSGYAMASLLGKFRNPKFPEVKQPIHQQMPISFILSISLCACLAPLCIFVIWMFYKGKEKMD